MVNFPFSKRIFESQRSQNGNEEEMRLRIGKVLWYTPMAHSELTLPRWKGQPVNSLSTLKIAHIYSNQARRPECEASPSASTCLCPPSLLLLCLHMEELNWNTSFHASPRANVAKVIQHQGPSFYSLRRPQTHFNCINIILMWTSRTGE